MDYLWTILLGAIQGATEFLPVSSSGHLAVGQILLSKFNISGALSDQPMLLEILLHLATLLAVVLIYRKDIQQIIMGAGRAISAIFKGRLVAHLKTDDSSNIAAAIIIGTIPTGVLGYLMKDIAGSISSTPSTLGLLFIICACFLFVSKRWGGGDKRLTLKAAILIGIIQGIAVLPGISRSGVTIVFALALGLKREEAAKFSFLLSIPAIIGAAILKIDPSSIISSERLVAYGLGAATAFVVGLGALLLLIKMVKDGRLWLFAPYMGAVGLALLVFL